MSGTYAVLDAAFLAVIAVLGCVAAVVAARRARRSGGASAVARWRRRTVVTGLVVGVVLLVMTIVFDNVIVGLRIVAYDPALVSGARIGAIPVEDLGYAVGAVVLLPSLWVLFARPVRTGADAAARADASAGVDADGDGDAEVLGASTARPEGGASRGAATPGAGRRR